MPKFTLLGLLLPPAHPPPCFFLPICQITWFGKHLIVHCMTLMFDVSFLLQLKKKKKLEKKVQVGKNREDSFVCLQICFCLFFSCVGPLFCSPAFSERGLLNWENRQSVLILPEGDLQTSSFTLSENKGGTLRLLASCIFIWFFLCAIEVCSGSFHFIICSQTSTQKLKYN